MNRNRQRNRYIELEELVGRDNLNTLMSEYGGKALYIPRIKKHDKRIPYLRTVQLMKEYLDEGRTIEEIAAENLASDFQRRTLQGLVKYCRNRCIRSFDSLLSALPIFTGKEAEKLLVLIGAAAFANLLEYRSGKTLYIPLSPDTFRPVQNECTDANILFDLMSGLSAEDTAIKNNVSVSKVRSIEKIYRSDSS